MHPDFWLVLARLFRPVVITVGGTIPALALVSSPNFVNGASLRGFLTIGFLTGLALVISAAPVLLLDELPELRSTSRPVQLLRALLLLGPVPATLVFVILKLLEPGRGMSPASLLRAAVITIPPWSLLFATLVGVPLLADHLRHVFRRVPPRPLTSLAVRALAAPLATLVCWGIIGLGAFLIGLWPDPTPWPDDGGTAVMLLAFSAAWVVNLGLVRALVDGLIRRLEARAEAAL